MRKLLYFFAAFFALGLASCQKNDLFDSSPSGNDTYGKNGFTLNYYVNGSSINTYATVMPEEGEDYINTLYMLFFKSSTSGTGEFVEYLDLTPEDGNPMTSIGVLDIDFDSSSKLNKSTSYNILMVANIESYLNGDIQDWLDLLDNDGYTEDEVIQQVKIYIEGQQDDDETLNDHLISPDNLPMSAIIKKDAGQEYVTAELVRAVTRFDVINNDDNYKLVSASIWNAFTETTVWESRFNSFDLDRTGRYYGVATTTNEIKGGLYSFENYVTIPEQNDEKTTCLILGFTKVGETDVMYYRVNVNAQNIGQQLKRNNVYKVKVSRVKGKGANSEKDAYTNNEFLLDININEWNVDDQGNIQYDGENILAVPISSIKFSHEAETREYSIFTLGEGTLEISKSDLPQGITAELNGNILKVSCTTSANDKVGTIELRFGTMKSAITIHQTVEATNFLELSVTSIPAFPKDPQQMEGNVKVTSSGPWTATIYNDQSNFTFQGGTSKVVETGVNDDTFTISTRIENTAALPNYAFVHVVLDDDVEVTRTLVLTQNGKGGFDLSPAVDAITFNPDGFDPQNLSNNYFEFTIAVSSSDPWEVVYYSGDQAFTATVTDVNKFRIEADLNDSESPLSAAFRVRLIATPGTYKTITVNQQAHSLQLDPMTVKAVPTSGGVSDAIQVKSTRNWTATIESNNDSAGINAAGILTYGGSPNQTFGVYFPQLKTPNFTPEATVTVTLDNTSITKTIVVTQAKMSGKAITVGTMNNALGRFDAVSNNYYLRYVNRMGNSWRDVNNFGPSGTCYVPSLTFPTQNRTAQSSYNIYVVNAASMTATYGNPIKTWISGANDRIMFVIGNAYLNGSASYILQRLESCGVISGYTGVNAAAIPAGTARTLNNTPTQDSHPLMDWLLKSGPFTENDPITRDDVRFVSNTNVNAALTSWPSTMIPIMMDPTNTSRMTLGIDPTNRIVFCTDIEMFTDYNNASANFNGSYADGNTKFMNNLLAWMTYAAQFGPDFINDFIQ